MLKIFIDTTFSIESINAFYGYQAFDSEAIADSFPVFFIG